MPEKIATTSDIDEGEVQSFELGDDMIAIANVEGTYYAFTDVCTHAQCSLSGGELEGARIECPCHGSVFDVTDGSVKNPPATEPLQIYEVIVEGNDILIEI